ncbi:L,D-transpeptidase family protein [Benzoatithermus flavus]|uniref:L,D-transpeptidase family protein n=1 Tax=Benzoatithermus flavus TaxID=3108223 RepID=A0ABU8XV96_9PROT
MWATSVAAAMLAGAALLHGSPSAGAGEVLKADKIVVVKSERRLYLLHGGEIIKSYRVALGRQPKGTKIYEGDGRTPEGVYRVAAFNPDSRFYRSIRVSYPNEADLTRARALGQSVGGNIMIHGLAPERRQFGSDHWLYNWTSGCIAVTDKEIDEIWQRVELGTPIEIRP